MAEDEKPLGTPRDMLELALRKEKAAYKFYDRLVQQSKVRMVSEMLEKLRNEEYKHVELVEKMISRMELGRL